MICSSLFVAHYLNCDYTEGEVVQFPLDAAKVLRHLQDDIKVPLIHQGIIRDKGPHYLL